jgi:hypothetical protein
MFNLNIKKLYIYKTKNKEIDKSYQLKSRYELS